MILHAILTPAEIDALPETDLSETVCVVFDVLRATSSILTALAFGAEEICPVATIEEALEQRKKWPDATLGGERFGDRIEGFDVGNSPLEYRRNDLKRIITTTTNGTVALRACAAAREVWVGALLNMGALAERLRNTMPQRVTLICAGTFRDIALEDVLAAGMLADAFPEAMPTDAARVAHACFLQHCGNLGKALEFSKNGSVLVSKGRTEELAWCAQVACFPFVGVMRNGVIRRE